MVFLKWREAIRYNLGKKDRVILTGYILALVLDVSLFIALLFVFGRSFDYVVVRYNIYFGISALGPWYQLLWMPFVGLLVLAVNFFLSLALYLNHRLLSYLLAVATPLINLMLVVAGFLSIYSNT